MTPTTIQLSKREKAIYRTTTGIVCVIMIFSIINFIFNDHFPFPNGPEGAFVHLGLPRYFKIELTTAKILGVLALLIPSVPFKIKEFAYFGFWRSRNLDQAINYLIAPTGVFNDDFNTAEREAALAIT
jgi:hypothetical protein